MRHLLTGFLCVLAVLAPAMTAKAQQLEPIRIGVVYDYTGRYANQGALAAAIGTQIAITMVNQRGGVAGRLVEAVFADSKSNVGTAIEEAQRLSADENVALVTGFFSSAHCYPLAEAFSASDAFLWLGACKDSLVLKQRNLEGVFRVRTHTDQFAEAACVFLNEQARTALGVDSDKLRVAIVFENGAFGTRMANRNKLACTQLGLNIVVATAYDPQRPDTESLMQTLIRGKPDAIIHTGWLPDIRSFLSNAKESGLTFQMLVGQGEHWNQLPSLRADFESDLDHLFMVGEIPAQNLNPQAVAPGLKLVIDDFIQRYQEDTGSTSVPVEATVGFNQAYILLTDVMPRAIRNHGGLSQEALIKAAQETDLPAGTTIQGFGVRFHPADHPLAGQNMRAIPSIRQMFPEGPALVWPATVRVKDPVSPMPNSSPFFKPPSR
ncbi:MAG: ABC transporter substrate-binding protein [Alphaproteobacteria bacterium]|nr:ABC transporter substrate-binding protein [Alphaproteobacteria bacterium]